ncbi:cytochrome c5 [Silvibacterium bohemicum]|uniref:Cytochrome c5 n=1 Tax=Silvibacterium bohemicum TaxID=1577686 RepID=A0A841K1W6_9BACT|nr:cytochrome c [Silvibacterium bohemicum]MBB6146587.1 cytochrome c5 [Silvibacterium bohemicum]
MAKQRLISKKTVLVVLAAVGVWIGAAGLLAQSQSPEAAKPAPQAAQASDTDRGEKVFANNCSRCHKPPMTIPPRITGTVVMHMRVRARLSRADEQALLRYLAP